MECQTLRHSGLRDCFASVAWKEKIRHSGGSMSHGSTAENEKLEI